MGVTQGLDFLRWSSQLQRLQQGACVGASRRKTLRTVTAATTLCQNRQLLWSQNGVRTKLIWKMVKGIGGADAAGARISLSVMVQPGNANPHPYTHILDMSTQSFSSPTFPPGSHAGTEFSPLEFTATETATKGLCGCKQTKNPPYCDGSHNTLAQAEVWKHFVISGKQEVAKGVVKFSVAVPGSPELLQLQGQGSHFYLRAEGMTRPYTPYVEPGSPSMLQFVIKGYTQRNGLSRLLTSLTPGQQLEMTGPVGGVPYSDTTSHLALVAGGTGLTPMLQVLYHLIQQQEQGAAVPSVTLVCANRTEDDIILRSELEALARDHTFLKVVHVLEKPPLGWTGKAGYVNDDIIAAEVPPPSDSTRVYCCGPPGFMGAVRNSSTAAGHKQGNVFLFGE